MRFVEDRAIYPPHYSVSTQTLDTHLTLLVTIEYLGPSRYQRNVILQMDEYSANTEVHVCFD